ncbi:MAG: hypothetical protein ACI3XQ_11445 [Eubacteriales bacterium]
MKTIRQLAGEMGISRQALYKRVLKLPRETFFTAEDKTIYLTEEAEKILVSENDEKKRKKEVKPVSTETIDETEKTGYDGANSETGTGETFSGLSEEEKTGETEGEKVVSGNRGISGFMAEMERETEAMKLKLSAATETIRILSVSEEELRGTCAFLKRQIEEKDEQIKSLLSQNANLTQALSDAMDSTKGAQALHANDIMRIEAAETKEPEKKKRKMWIFGK